jgi:hypothetical protein
MEKTIWTPSFSGNESREFRVYLDRNFAREMIQSQISSETQEGMNRIAEEELKKLGTNWPTPYGFYESSGFVSQFSIGQNGVWLSAERLGIDDLLIEREDSKPIKYDSHNVDFSKQVYDLMVLFDKWAEYAEDIRGV